MRFSGNRPSFKKQAEAVHVHAAMPLTFRQMKLNCKKIR
jgi:hypothetical protein